MKNRTLMTQILQMIADLISVNLLDQRHLRSVNSEFKKPKIMKTERG